MKPAGLHPKIIAASLIGSSIEWFDYFLYGTLSALAFGKLFFPRHDPGVSLMLSYLTFSMSFFVRPLGGMIFSHIGDRFGRKKSLIATLSLMGAATAGIGILPTYAQAGIMAPTLLILLRLVQGIGLGGEWGGALLLSFEHTKPDKKNFAASFPQAGVTIGMLLATFIVGLLETLPDASFLSWGWRIPFLVSVALVLFGLWLRHDIDETPDFLENKSRQAKLPLAILLRDHWRAVLVAVGAKAVETGPFYIITVFVISFATTKLGESHSLVLNAVTIGALVSTIAIPFCGALADRIGAKKLYLTGTILMAVLSIPYFLMLQQWGIAGLVFATILLFGLVWPMITSVLGSLLSFSFSPEVRFSGITLGYQLGAALIGGTSPLIAQALLNQNHGQWMPIAIYMIATSLISLVSVGFGYRR